MVCSGNPFQKNHCTSPVKRGLGPTPCNFYLWFLFYLKKGSNIIWWLNMCVEGNRPNICVFPASPCVSRLFLIQTTPIRCRVFSIYRIRLARSAGCVVFFLNIADNDLEQYRTVLVLYFGSATWVMIWVRIYIRGVQGCIWIHIYCRVRDVDFKTSSCFTQFQLEKVILRHI